MNEEQLKALLAEQRASQASEHVKGSSHAKQRAIDLALEAYEQAPAKNNHSFFQGILAGLRLMFTDKNETQEDTMNIDKRKTAPWVFGGMTTAVVGVFAIILIDFEPQPLSVEDYSIPDYTLNLPEEAHTARKKDALAEQAEYDNEEIALTDTRQRVESALMQKREASGITESMSTADIAPMASSQMASAPAMAPAAMKMAAKPMPQFEPGIVRDEVQYRDNFESAESNPLMLVSENPVSTFSIDVDTASYSFVRRQLNAGRLPNPDAVRIEEMLNYFDYQYPLAETKNVPFKPSVSVIDSPWAEGKKLVHIGIKGYDLVDAKAPRSNLVFLLDVSGSMNSADKLPLVKQSMNLLLSQLQPEDTVAIVVYAGAAGAVLEPTAVKDKQTILAALNRLEAGGSTAGAQGIDLAYQLAEANFDKNAVNRIMLATDGDFNIGQSSPDALKTLIERKRDKGIYLSVLGFGQGNYNDHLMQELAQNGNGVAAYIDTLSEAQKVLVDEATSTLFPIAKDVKIQVEFNPEAVSEYRLIGYETRALKREDFNNDKVDAGDIGAGHTVTAIYEITPKHSNAKVVDDLRYGEKHAQIKSMPTEYGFLKLRYKLPSEDTSKLIETPIAARNTEFVGPLLKQEVQFATSVAGFAQLLKDDKYLDDWSYDDAIALALSHRGEDTYGYRNEFVQLMRLAKSARDL